MNRKYNIQLNLSPYSNYYEDGGNMGGMVYTPDENGFVRGSLSTNWTPQGISPNNVVLSDEQQDMVKSAERKQTAHEKAQNFIDNMNGGGASGWNAIGPAAANISNAFLDTESDLADRTAAAMGMPALASIWKADWKKGNEALTDYRNKLNYVKKNSFIQDANSSWGAANAVKLNSKPIAPITPQSQLLTWKDFRGNMFMKGAGAVAQGAASGSVGGPWGALGGTITGLLGSLFGGIGAKKRAKSAYNSYLNKWQTLNSANQAQFNKAVTDQTLSNMQALANGNIQQRINDMANIRAYGGNLYPDGGGIDPYYPESQDPTAVNWLSDWYRQRPEQLKNTFYGSTYDMPNPNISGEYEELSDIPLDRTINPSSKFFDDSLYRSLIDKAATTSPVYRMDMPSTTLGEYSPSGQNIITEDGFVNYPNAAHTISYNMRDVPAFANPDEDYYDKETLPLRIHENNHSITHGFDSVAKEINNRIIRKDGVERDSYKDNPYEVHSYMMEFRNKAGLNPTDIITKDVLNKYRKELKETNLDRYTDDSLIDLLNNVVDSNDMKRYSNVVAFGGGLDLSPNMMSLWNNKQQIDQQKAMNQQFSLGLGNTAFNKFDFGGRFNPIDPEKETEIPSTTAVNNVTPAIDSLAIANQLTPYQQAILGGESPLDYVTSRTREALDATKEQANKDVNTTVNMMYGDRHGEADYGNRYAAGGPVNPPNRPLTREEIDKLTQAEKEEYAKKQAIRLYKELYAPSPALHDSREEDDEHTYNVLNRPDQNPFSSLNVFDKLFKPSNSGYIFSEENKRKEAAEKAQQHSGSAFSWANGGQMTSADVPNGMQYYANGGSHEENPYGGIQVGTDQQGNANLVEKGEFRWHDFVFSDRVNVDANLLSSFNLMPTTKHQNKKAAKGKLSYADMAKKYAKRNKELENDPITKNSMEAFMQRLANAQEYQKKAEQLEAQKQNELQDYKTALNKQNNNPMYGNMKYNGMGNAAAQQGVNAGVGAGTENPMSNADLSNVNRSGNEMMAAYGGNLYPIGGWLRRLLGKTQETQNNQQPSKNEWGINKSLDNVWGHEPTFEQRWEHPAIYMPNMPEDLNERLQNIGLGTYNGHIPMYDYVYTPAYGKGSNDLYGNYVKNQYLGNKLQNKYLSDMSFGSTMQPAQVQQNLDNQTNGNNLTFEQWRDMQYGNNNSPYMMSSQEDIPNASVLQTQGTQSNDSAETVNYIPNNISGVSTNIPQKTTSNTNPDAAVPSDAKEVPLYNTAGRYAQFGKGIMPLIWDWAGRTNTKYDPYYVDANRLEALANEGPVLRTADTIGGYRAPNLMDAERMNNAAQAQGLAALQSALSTGNGNRGFAAVQAQQQGYNTGMNIGNNYATVQQANNAERLQTDQLNHAIDVANQNAINAMRQDNQRAEQAQHQLAVSGTAQAANLRQNENFHADTVNTERMKNKAANQAAYVDNALNYFTTQAMENQELNARNNDPTNPYWIDKDGRVHYTGDSGLTQAIRDAFGNDEYGRNGTFTGERLAEWNDLIKNKKYSAKYLKEHPELWEHLVAQQREANKIDAEKAKQAKLEELEALRGTYQSNLARLDALRDSGAIISDPSYNLYAGWAGEDYSGNQGLLRTRNQALDQYITQIGNNYDRYLYEKQLAQNKAKALGGYLNSGQNNNNNYYSYTRI